MKPNDWFAEADKFNKTLNNGSVYVENGFKNRADYLDSLCDEYPEDVVMALAELLGPTEDFDGLIASLED